VSSVERRDEAWSRSAPARAVRELLICGLFGPLVGAYARREIIGLEHVAQLSGPAVFVANHNSHVDTPVLLRALPGARRRRTAVAAAADYFYSTRSLAVAVSLTFGTVPVARRAETPGGSHAFLERLIQDGWSLVLFAEGTRSRDGRLGPLRPGAASLSARQGVPIVPVFLAGTGAIMPPGRSWMVRPSGAGAISRHTLSIRFGAPLSCRPGEDQAVVMERVRRFFQECGSSTDAGTRLQLRGSEKPSGAEVVSAAREPS
jgi:1-acyl-sn-glycerol-3-phosphate acyltransferase